MALVHELLIENNECLTMTASDSELHSIIRESDRSLYSLLFSKGEAFSTGNLTGEVEWWMECGNCLYVRDFQLALESVHNSSVPAGRVPPHLFGQLAKLPQGQSQVIPLLPKLMANLSSSSEVDLAASLFALAHFASEKSTHQVMHHRRAFETMIGLWPSASYQLKGFMISAFSLIAHSKYFSAVLAANKWQVFRFGDHVSVFPSDLGDISEVPFIPPTPMKSDSTAESMIKQLASPITIGTAKVAVEQMDKTPELSRFSREFMSKFFLVSEARELLLKTFAEVPILAPSGKAPRETELAAVTRAKLFVALTTGAVCSWSNIEVPAVPLVAIDETKVCSRCPEVFVSDREFLEVAGRAKKRFYEASEAQIREIRHKLMTHAKQ
jgi:hypothetical protein